jgi:pyruvate dehydrogenase E1 component alpha subunit
MGDAAQNQGQFYEALNMAATWDLPVLFIIENNRYGMGTDIRRTTSVDHLWKRALAFDVAHSDCDGMNVISTYEHVKGIVDQMRKDKKPYLLEALTYRYRGHSVSDPGTYRTKEEVEDYQKNKDPIMQLERYLVEEKFATQEELKSLDKEAKEMVNEAEAFADASPNPPVEELWDHVLAL